MANDLTQKLNAVFDAVRNEVTSLRTGRASPALVEDIEVDAYGAKQPLKALAAIVTPEPRQLVIQPWDKSVLPVIEKAIRGSALGLNPIADRDVIRLTLPVLTEERKRDLVKVLRAKLEEGRIQIRRLRDEAMKEVDARARTKEISEDEKFREKEALEKQIGEVNKKIEELGERKEAEIMAG